MLHPTKNALQTIRRSTPNFRMSKDLKYQGTRGEMAGYAAKAELPDTLFWAADHNM